MQDETVYLGDGLYAIRTADEVILTTGHHDPEKAENIIYLDIQVIQSLIKFLQKRK